MSVIKPKEFQPMDGMDVRSDQRRLSENERILRSRKRAEQSQAAKTMLSSLGEASLNITPIDFNVASPITSLDRLLAFRRRKRVIPAITTHREEESTPEGLAYTHNNTHYHLAITHVAGYPLDSIDEKGVSGRKRHPRILTIGGHVGKLITPFREVREATGLYVYSTPQTSIEQTVEVMRPEDDFQNRDCHTIWGPSLELAAELPTDILQDILNHLTLLLMKNQTDNWDASA